MPRTPTRPGTVIFVAIVLIVLGSFSLLGGLIGAPSLLVIAFAPEPPPRPAGQPDGDLNRMLAKEVPFYYPVAGGFMLFDFLFGVAQIACGIGLLRMNPACRVPAILATLGKMLLSFSSHTYQIIVVIPVTERFFQANLAMMGPPGQPQPALPFNLTLVMQAATALVVGVTVIIQLSIFLTITLILASGGTKAAFAAAAAPQPAEDDERKERRRKRYDEYDDDEDVQPKAPPETGITDRS